MFVVYFFYISSTLPVSPGAGWSVTDEGDPRGNWEKKMMFINTGLDKSNVCIAQG